MKESLKILFEKIIEDETIKLTLAVKNQYQVNDANNLIDTLIDQQLGIDDNDPKFIEAKEFLDEQTGENELMTLDTEIQKNLLLIKNESIIKEKIEIIINNSEDNIVQTLKSIRLIIDLSEIPDLFTQISGISSGIPQINMRNSSYIENKKNGIIISKIADLKPALDHYLIGLKNWNQSLVYSVQQIEKYSDWRLIEKWTKN
jgi:accessory secretory protein Asp1